MTDKGGFTDTDVFVHHFYFTMEFIRRKTGERRRGKVNLGWGLEGRLILTYAMFAFGIKQKRRATSFCVILFRERIRDGKIFRRPGYHY